MDRLDHCFLLAVGGERALAFCRSDGVDLEAARQEVSAALQREKGYRSFRLAYLGALDYREMESEVEGMLEPFERLGPVWLGFFRWEGGSAVGEESLTAEADSSEVDGGRAPREVDE